MEELHDPSPNPWQSREKQQMNDWLSHELQKLPPRQRIAISLVHLEECGNIEAADIMNVSVDALESLLSRGRRKLRELLTPQRSEFGGGLK